MENSNGKTRRIIYIGGFELPDKNAAAQRVVSNAKAFRDLHYEVIFIDINRACSKNIIETKSEIFGFTRYSMKYTNKRLISIKDLKSVYKFYCGEVYAIIAYNYPGIALKKMRSFCKKNDVKLIADCTEWYGMQGENCVIKAIKGIDSYIRMNIVQPRLDGMIAISHYIEKFYKGKLPTVYIPPLVDLTEEKWKSKEIYKHEGIKIVYAGNPIREKDKVNFIIRAISEIDRADIYFDVVGLSVEQFLYEHPEEEESLKKLGCRVKFMGRVNHLDAIQYVKQSDFTMFYREKKRVSMAGFPTKFVESITCKTPVITNKIGDLDEYLDEGVNGYWVDENISQSLNLVFNQSLEQIKRMKLLMNNELFDYHKYLDEFANLLAMIKG